MEFREKGPGGRIPGLMLKLPEGGPGGVGFGILSKKPLRKAANQNLSLKTQNYNYNRKLEASRRKQIRENQRAKKQAREAPIPPITMPKDPGIGRSMRVFQRIMQKGPVMYRKPAND